MRILQNCLILHANKLTKIILHCFTLGFSLFQSFVFVYFVQNFYIAQKRRENVAKRNAKESLIVCVCVYEYVSVCV